jgi:Asp-tRNA(Asn)/Glu-tRNA(Gln) amidotransferase A subunit family amidase
MNSQLRMCDDPGVMHSNAIFSVTELLAMLQDGRLSAEELLADCKASIAAHDRSGPGLGAVISEIPDAPRAASECDRARGRDPRNLGVLHGMPVIVKDNIDVKGIATTSGCRAMTGAIALRDADQTARLRQAGAVLLAKANLSEFSFEIRSRSSVRGDVLNPFDRTVTAGGSSGGTAAAIAAGLAVAGLGTDTGGSIRIPAAFNGLVGLRPTHGLLCLRGVAPLAPTSDTVGPIARSTQDVAYILAALTETPISAWLMPQAPAGQRLEGARIGILRQAFGKDPSIQMAMERAVQKMADAGAMIFDPVELATDVLPIGLPATVDWEFRPSFDAYLSDNFAPGAAPTSLAEIFASGQFLPDHRESLRKRLAAGSLENDDYRHARASQSNLRTALTELMQRLRLDALLYPTSQVTPTSLDNPACGWAPELAASSGWPALTLPIGRASNGIPIGLELLGAARSEPVLLGLAHDIERLQPGRPIPHLSTNQTRATR